MGLTILYMLFPRCDVSWNIQLQGCCGVEMLMLMLMLILINILILMLMLIIDSDIATDIDVHIDIDIDVAWSTQGLRSSPSAHHSTLVSIATPASNTPSIVPSSTHGPASSPSTTIIRHRVCGPSPYLYSLSNHLYSLSNHLFSLHHHI